MKITTLAGVLLVLAATASAQDWPVKPVRIVSPFAPGGSSDTLGRVLADQLAERAGQPFYIENRAGAGGLIGSAAVAAAEPDGYTLLISSIGTHVIAPATSAGAGFDPIKNFSHVAYIGGQPIVMVVHPSLGVKTFADFLALAKKSTQPISYVSPGPGTLGQLVAESWAQTEHVPLSHVPYKGSGQAINDLVAGHVRVGSITWLSALGQMRAGAIVPIAVSGAKRTAEFPDVPTLKELGYPDLVATTWFALAGPAGIPRPIVQRLNTEVAAALAAPAVKKRLDAEAIETDTMTPDELTRFVSAEIAKWGPIARRVINEKPN